MPSTDVSITAGAAILQVAAVRAALDKYGDRLDEGLLSNCFAWIKKCQDDGMDTMVTLLQKVLQLYAAKMLRGQETEVSRALWGSLEVHVQPAVLITARSEQLAAACC